MSKLGANSRTEMSALSLGGDYSDKPLRVCIYEIPMTFLDLMILMYLPCPHIAHNCSICIN